MIPTQEYLEKFLIRPLEIGEEFKVKDELILNTNGRMRSYTNTWLKVESVMETYDTVYAREEDISGENTVITYEVEEEQYSGAWYTYHMNIYETNMRLLHADRSMRKKRSAPDLPLI